MKKLKLIFLLLLLTVMPVYADFSDSDLNQDGVVGYEELLILCQNWLNDCYVTPCFNIDTNQDTWIDLADLAVVSQNWLGSNSSYMQIAHWTFDEGSGTDIYDSANANHGQFLNASSYSWASGKRSWAFTFDGDDDIVSINQLDNGLGQYFTRDFSIALWLCQYDQAGYQVPIGIESTSHFTNYGFEGITIELYDGLPLIYIAYADDAREVVSASSTLPSGQWTHLAVIRNNDNLKIYINGILDSSQTVTSSNIKFDSEWPGYDSIGACNDSYYGNQDHFDGKIDDVRLYNFPIHEPLVIKLARQDTAWLPQPVDNSQNIPIDTALIWQKGLLTDDTNCHDIYLSTNYDDVLNANEQSQCYQLTQTSTYYDPPLLEYDTMYYWRVDDICSGQANTGHVWSFRTLNQNHAITASPSQVSFDPYGAYDNDRFSYTAGQIWKGQNGQASWYWQIQFNQPQQIGSILQITGDHEQDIFINAPSEYIWEYSTDGQQWTSISETSTANNDRLFRIHRLTQPITAKYFRLEIADCHGNYPSIREIEFYPETDSTILFPEWIVALCITESSGLPGHAQGFISLAKSCPEFTDIQAQEVWLEDFNDVFLNIEPYPLATFLSGSFVEWCERTRPPFAGLQQVVENGNIPIWGSCGGAQLLGLILDPGCQNEWDCPRCRNPIDPLSPIYGHIGYLNPLIEPTYCGNYDNAIMETGPRYVQKVGDDPAFAGLSSVFRVFESHMGQLEYLPTGWHRTATKSVDTYTENQCFRQNDRYIYGAQFHIENYHKDTWSNSITIMSNFLNLALQWGGYQPL